MNAKTLTEKYAQEVVAIRRWLHVHAETAWKEYETTDYIEVYLKKLGLEPHRFECGTGCWAMIYGEHPDKQKKTILLRADIDAMPGNDLKNVEYKSLHEGAVHSCGHDGNTAMTLAAAKVLVENKALLKGDVKLVFEPAEELSTGGNTVFPKACSRV